eukprot:GHVU01218959.1.p1 GENE.GHVU01218959.1~~GHVU01218959.1.p1  ORF type:complete len:155 (+),score=14.63 GHVU01218959.1:346-810(+)
MVSGERGNTTTLVTAVNPFGDTSPPVFIYAKRVPDDALHGTPPGSRALSTKSGWQTTRSFRKWLAIFQESVASSSEDRVLLVADGHGTHVTDATKVDAKKRGIEIVTLIPHSSHRLQPLDVSVFSSFELQYCVSPFMVTNRSNNERTRYMSCVS